MPLAQKRQIEYERMEDRPKIKVQRILRKKPKKSNKGFIVISLFFIMSMIFVLSGYIQIHRLENRMRDSKRQLEQIEAQKDQLEISIHKNLSMERIENIARSALGMDFPTPDQVIYQELRTKNEENN